MPLVLVGLCLSNIKIEHGHPPQPSPQLFPCITHLVLVCLWSGYELFECVLTGHRGRFVSVRGGPTDSSPEFDGQEVECDSPDDERGGEHRHNIADGLPGEK